MRINSISNLNLYSNKYNRFTINSLGNNKVVSFNAQNQHSKKALEYFERINEILYNQQSNKTEYNKAIDEFFTDLNSENEIVKNNFLYLKDKNDENIFTLVILNQNNKTSQILVNMIKTLSEKNIFKFLTQKGRFLESPFFIAASYDDTGRIFKQLKDMVKTLTPEHQADFYYEYLDNPYSGKFNISDELFKAEKDKLLDELLKDKTEFEKKYPDIAKHYKKIAEKINKESKNNPNKNTELTTTKSQNFRIYSTVKTNFSDIGGMFNVKNQIQNELLNILNNPKVKNSDKPSGIILYGPPGTGKTLLATAIAGEAQVPFISTNGSSFNEIYVGTGSKNVRELYSTARNLAMESPKKTAIIFIDEADAIAAKRSDTSNREQNNTLNALLSEMDGVQSKEDDSLKIITILATNRKDLFDEAFRKGRIDLEFKIDDPRFSEKARREILEINAKNKPFKNNNEKKKLLDELAKTSSGLSGADLADILKKAYRKTLYLGREEEYITQKDITEAKLEAIVGIRNDNEKSEYEQKNVIAHEAGHAINQLIMNRVFANESIKSKIPIQKLDFIVNESRGNAAGVTIMKPSPDNSRLTIESLISSLVVNYGGYSIEEAMFDGHTDGVSSDLANSTDLIFKSVTKWGLGSKTKFIGLTPNGYTYELFKADIKQDIMDYSNIAMEISSNISNFVHPFIKEYIEIFANEKNDKTAIITGETFEKLFDKWLKNNGNKKEFEQLCLEIKEKISNFKTKIKS